MEDEKTLKEIILKEIVDSCFDDIAGLTGGNKWKYTTCKFSTKSFKLSKSTTKIITFLKYDHFIDYLYTAFIDVGLEGDLIKLVIEDTRSWRMEDKVDQFTIQIGELEYTLTKYFLEKNGDN